jgi:hypothetical protein
MRAQLEPLYEYAAQRPPDAVFIIAPSIERNLLSFERRTGHALLVMNKFIPSLPDGILEWYRRRLFQNDVFANGCQADAPYRVSFLIAEASAARTLAATCGPIVFEHGSLAVVRNDSAAASSASGASHAAPAAPSEQ